MAVVVIAGSGRGAGKTAVGCALIAAMPEFAWTAVKVTPHGHGLPMEIWEEMDRDSDKDTGRYLAAGARRAFLVLGSTGDGLADRILMVRSSQRNADSILVESNQLAPWELAQYEEAGICLVVLAGVEAEWKPSLENRIASADAVVLSGGLSRTELPPRLRGLPSFELPAGQWFTPELLEFVRERLTG